MNTDQRNDKPTETMFESAAEWAARAQSGSLDARDAAALECWLHADRRHRIAYARMESLLELTAGIELACPAEKTTSVDRRRQTRTRWSKTGLGMAAGLAAILFAVARLYPMSDDALFTEPGEVRTVALADGSSVTLRGDSRLRIRYGLLNRRVMLDYGEAAFDVAHEPIRDFVVESADVRIVAVGTVFNVQVVDGLSTVTLLDGTVMVSDPAAGTAGPTLPDEIVILAPGEQVVFAADGTRSGVRKADLAQVTAWQDGRLVLRRRPLSELVDELNRNFAGNIRVEDPALSAIPVNVSMQLADRDTTLRRLEEQLPIAFEHSDNGRFVVRRRTPPR